MCPSQVRVGWFVWRFDRPCGPPPLLALLPAHFCIMDQCQGNEDPTSARISASRSPWQDSKILTEKEEYIEFTAPRGTTYAGGASIVLIQFLAALKVGLLTNLPVRPKAGATPMTDPSWE